MRIISYNVNGIRSAMNKGFCDWLSTNPADVICLQEIKANEADIDVSAIQATGYQSYFFPAQKKGYSGVGILTRLQPSEVICGNGFEQSDFEGRVMRALINGIHIICAYFPSGSSGDDRQAYKMQWLDEFHSYVASFKNQDLVICGDYNICHKPIDIHDPVSNKNSSGFLPEERAWMDKFFELGFTDTFRHVNDAPHQYSWWSYRAGARARNKGWRIDYISVSTTLAHVVEDAAIYPDIIHSDHCPIYVSLK